MKVRTCPYCNYKYPFLDYIRSFLFKLLWAEWNCKNCNKKITFNVKRRSFVVLGCALLFIMFLVIKNSMAMNLSWWILLIAVYFVGTILVYTFDTFDKVG